MSYVEIVVTISMVGVLWNAVLQSSWFVWSYREHHRKHYLDDKKDKNGF